MARSTEVGAHQRFASSQSLEQAGVPAPQSQKYGQVSTWDVYSHVPVGVQVPTESYATNVVAFAHSLSGAWSHEVC